MAKQNAIKDTFSRKMILDIQKIALSTGTFMVKPIKEPMETNPCKALKSVYLHVNCPYNGPSRAKAVPTTQSKLPTSRMYL